MTETANPVDIAIIGAGPAGLMAAERLAVPGRRVTVYDRMPSLARKFLLAGRGGLNLTHTEPREPFMARYGPRAGVIEDWLDAFSPAEMVEWCEGLDQPTFVGSSGRVFPQTMKASPLLRAWLARLDTLGVVFRTRWDWQGWSGDDLVFETPQGRQTLRPAATVLALGGASWPRMGSDGRWTIWLDDKGVEVVPLQPSNAGFNVAWSDILIDRFAGQPLKAISVSLGTFEAEPISGELMLTRYGLEGGALYALSAALREAITRDGQAAISLDLRPGLSIEALTERLTRPRRPGDSDTNWLRKAAGLSPAAIGVLRDIPGDLPTGADKLARRIKAVRLTLTGIQGLDRAISSAGGVTFEAVNDHLMLTIIPGTFVCGEMLDWEAPTGGYLIQASMASGVVAAQGVQDWLDRATVAI